MKANAILQTACDKSRGGNRETHPKKMDQSEMSDMSDDELAGDSFPTEENSLPVVDFGTQQHITGWKKTKLKQQQKKVKPGSFGMH